MCVHTNDKYMTQWFFPSIETHGEDKTLQDQFSGSDNGEGAHHVPPGSDGSFHTSSWLNFCHCLTDVYAEVQTYRSCRHTGQLTAIRSSVPLTAAHRSCLRSMTKMKPKSVDDKLWNKTMRKHVQHKQRKHPKKSVYPSAWGFSDEKFKDHGINHIDFGRWSLQRREKWTFLVDKTK